MNWEDEEWTTSDLYPGYRIYRPSIIKADNYRKRTNMYNPITKHRISIQYARYLIEIHLNRKLTDEEEAHHKDGNCTNDILDNIEVINCSIHRSLHAGGNQKSSKIITLKCAYCDCEFELTERVVKLRLKQSKSGKLYCSRDCHYKDRSPYELIVR
jgi:hypothetical protein